MAAEPADPFAAMSWRQRAALRRRLKGAWREGVAEQRSVGLAHLRTELIGVPVLSVGWHSTISEITYADGTVVRLWLSHRPAVKALRTAVRDGVVALGRADDHGHCWALYFATREGRRALMCGDLRVRTAQGGVAGWVRPEVSPQLV
jgi:hypothetical protein